MTNMKRQFSGIANAFTQKCFAEFGQYFVEDGNAILRIPAISEEVGDVIVTDDGDELTCTVGQIDHRHFEVFCARGTDENQREINAAEEAVSWVSAIVSDKVRFRIQMHQGRLVGSGSWYPEEEDAGPLLKITDEWKEYLWSGQVLHCTR